MTEAYRVSIVRRSDGVDAVQGRFVEPHCGKSRVTIALHLHICLPEKVCKALTPGARLQIQACTSLAKLGTIFQETSSKFSFD